jgi:DNA-binding transcriptional LysR family regulator
MNIEQIETFLDLCDTRSFNQTAERLGVTQSTISGRVRALETALNCRLLERSRAGTDADDRAGLRFEPHARAMRLAWRDGVQDARGAGSAARTARIGIQHDLLGDSVADWVTVLQEAMPQTALYVEADYSAQMCTDVASGALDLAIFYTPKPHPDLHFETLGEIAYVMVSTEAERLDRCAGRHLHPRQFRARVHRHPCRAAAGPVGGGGLQRAERGRARPSDRFRREHLCPAPDGAGVGPRRGGAACVRCAGDRAARLCLRASAQPAPPALSRALHALRAHLQAGQR